jgi:hypothetical protein
MRNAEIENWPYFAPNLADSGTQGLRREVEEGLEGRGRGFRLGA